MNVNITRSNIRSRLFCFIFLSVALVVSSCRNRNDEEEYNKEKKDPTLTAAYEEYDTLALKVLPVNLHSWIEYYQQFDSGFQLVNFKASGVVLHIDSMNNASANTN